MVLELGLSGRRSDLCDITRRIGIRFTSSVMDMDLELRRKLFAVSNWKS